MRYINCCKSTRKNKKCTRKDGKHFSLQRKFTKKRCIKGPVKGFTMRSSCAPYKFCKNKTRKKQRGGSDPEEKTQLPNLQQSADLLRNSLGIHRQGQNAMWEQQVIRLAQDGDERFTHLLGEEPLVAQKDQDPQDGGRVRKKKTRKAKAIFKKKNNVSGKVLFEDVKKGVKVTYDFKGLKNGKHGFHVHQKGDFKGDCNKAGPHFNPHGHSHAGRKSRKRHIGDLGNVTAKNGVTRGSFIDKKISLNGKNNIIGRSLIVHDLKDDLGKGKNEESLKTGNAGARLNCAKILKSNRKTKKKQFLYNPDDPSKSFDVYIDKNPKDTIPIKYTTVKDVKDTIKKLERLYKTKKYPHKRIWQVGMIMKVRLEAMLKHKTKKYPNAKKVKQRFNLANKYFKFLGKRTKKKDFKSRKAMTFKF